MPVERNADIAEYKQAKQLNYKIQLGLGSAYQSFGGQIGPRKEPKDDDEGGGDQSMTPEGHPLLSISVQHSGMPENENPNVPDNPEASKEFAHEMQLQNEKKLANSNANTKRQTMNPMGRS